MQFGSCVDPGFEMFYGYANVSLKCVYIYFYLYIIFIFNQIARPPYRALCSPNYVLCTESRNDFYFESAH